MMIDPATGMKPGERYSVEPQEGSPGFPGFFLDGKFYLDPELLTAIGWLEGQRFFYDALDEAGEPVFEDSLAGTVEGLALILADGTARTLTLLEVAIPADESQNQPVADAPVQSSSAYVRWRQAPPKNRRLALLAAALFGGCLAAVLRSESSGRR